MRNHHILVSWCILCIPLKHYYNSGFHTDENFRVFEVGCASRKMPLLMENTRGELARPLVKLERKTKKISLATEPRF